MEILTAKACFKKAKKPRKDKFTVTYEYAWSATNDPDVLQTEESSQISNNLGVLSQNFYTIGVNFSSSLKKS